MTQKYTLPLRGLSVSVFSICAVMLTAPAQAENFKEIASTTLKADGPDEGKSAYKLIRKAFGEKAMESPDLYKSNHTGQKHIIEDTDDVVGPHFVFLSHRDEDLDRDKNYSDRQRNEIKAYDKSKKRLKACISSKSKRRTSIKIQNPKIVISSPSSPLRALIRGTVQMSFNYVIRQA